MDKLQIFISSRGLSEQRSAVNQALEEIGCDAVMFESWPSAPNDPIEECLLHVEQSNAFILILGGDYGEVKRDGLSATHMEYRYAKEKNRPRFCYKIKCNVVENKQDEFIKEVEKDVFRCKEIIDDENLKGEVKRSLMQEFSRLFKEEYPILTKELPGKEYKDGANTIELPSNKNEILTLLKELYSKGKDSEIHHIAGKIEKLYPEEKEIMAYVYMSEINLGINKYNNISFERLNRAIDYWENEDSKNVCPYDYLRNYNLGNAYSSLKKYKEAIEKYNLALIDKPHYPPCLKNLGSVYYELDNQDKAIYYLENALKYDPTLMEGLLTLGSILIRKGDYLKSLSYLNTISMETLSSAQRACIYNLKATAYYKTNSLEMAIANIEDSIYLNSENEWSWMAGICFYSEMRRSNSSWNSNALKYFLSFIERYPVNSRAWAELAYIYLHKKMGSKSRKDEYHEKAKEAFLKSVSFGLTHDGLVYDKIGHLYQDEDDWENAKIYFQKAKEIDYGKFGYCYGVSLISLGECEEALPIVLDSATKYHKDALSWFQVAYCYETMKQFDNAIIAYKKAIELDEKYELAWFNLGGLYWNNNNKTKAKNIWNKAVELFPKNSLCNKVKELLANGSN
jgi:tetratricopeptide (TPR) repeat protein